MLEKLIELGKKDAGEPIEALPRTDTVTVSDDDNPFLSTINRLKGK